MLIYLTAFGRGDAPKQLLGIKVLLPVEVRLPAQVLGVGPAGRVLGYGLLSKP